MLWDDARRAGYVTAKTINLYGGLMGCRYWNSSSFDHVQAAKADFTNYQGLMARMPGCVSGTQHIGSQYDLAWATEFAHPSLYAGRKKFAYAHFCEGHGDSVPHTHTTRTTHAYTHTHTHTHTQRRVSQLDEGLQAFVGELAGGANNVVIVMSDHGGEPNERTALFLLLPNGMLEGDPRLREALEHNQHQWVSHYDVRTTIQQLFEYKRGGNFTSADLVSGAHADAQSLLVPIPGVRDCSAKIHDGMKCPLVDWVPLTANDTSLAQEGAREAFRAVNVALDAATGGTNTSCAWLTLGRVVSAKTRSFRAQSEFEVSMRIKAVESLYAEWEALLTYTVKQGKREWKVVYRQQSTTYAPFDACTDDRVDKSFCACGGI
jgi:hypothetical protein